MAYTIYLRTNKVNGKQYVGQTGDFKQRERKWRCLKTDYANKLLTQERNQYGLDNFNVVIIGHCETQEEAYELEEKYVKELGTKYPDGYNMGYGGKLNKGYKLSEEHKQIISDANKGKPTWNKGKHLSEETRKKMSKSHKGRRRSEEWIKNNSEAVKKPILQIDRITGEVIREWKSATDAARELGFKCKTNIGSCCKGEYGYKTAYGYKWKYAED